MQLWIDALNIRQRDGLVKQLLIERKRKATVQAMTMEYSNAKNTSDKVKV